VRASRRTRTSDLQFRKLASYPLDHGSRVGGERFELSQPKPRLYGPLVSPMNSPPLGWPEGLSPSCTRVTTWLLVDFGIGHSTPRRTRTSNANFVGWHDLRFTMGACVPAAGAEPAAFASLRRRSATELRGHGGDDGFRSRCLHLDGVALSRLSYITTGSGTWTRTRRDRLTTRSFSINGHRIEWRGRDSNPRYRAYETRLEPNSSPPRCSPTEIRTPSRCLKGSDPNP
jgi:hypothetical protein